MNERAELYGAVIKALEEVKEIKHIDLWNRNVEFIEQESPWLRPAVFVEFGDASWTPLSSSPDDMAWRGSGTVNLHIVTDWLGSSAAGSPDREMSLSHFELPGKIQRKLENLKGDGFDSLHLTSTMTNHDHEDIVENIEVYKVKYSRTMAYKEE